MSFWQSELGEIDGTPDSAFAQSMVIIPDGTRATAKIEKFTNSTRDGQSLLNIQWRLIDGDFKNRIVFQKIHVFDGEPKKRHRALNMLKLIYGLCGIKPVSADAPSDAFLAQFHGRMAGIVIQEWQANGKGGNWVSEVHPASGFVSETGTKLEVTHPIESALNRNPRGADMALDDDIPF